MAVSLSTVEDVARYLKARGFEVMIIGARVALRAQIEDYPAHVNIQFRSSRVVRVTIGLPVEVSEALRETFALYLMELNRRRLGAGFVMTGRGVAFMTQIPLDHQHRLAAEPLDRTIALGVDASRAALATLRRIGATGLASV